MTRLSSLDRPWLAKEFAGDRAGAADRCRAQSGDNGGRVSPQHVEEARVSTRFQAPVRVAVAAAAVIGWSSAAVPAQQPRPAEAQSIPVPPGPASAEKYMNVQVLKDLPAAQLPDAMVFMAASLGANCGFCHVRTPQGEWAFEKDDKPEKKTARQMLRMTQGLNAQFFDGKPTVTCSSCHQSRHEPSPMPPLAQALTPDQAATLAARGEGRGGRPPAPTETADEVIAKYVQALGGEQRLRTMKSAVLRGTAIGRGGDASPVVVEQAGPDRYRSTVESKPPMTRAFDGDSAWLDTGGHVRQLEGVQLAYAASLDDTGLALRLKDKYAGLTVGRYDRIDGRDVVWLNGRPSAAVTEALAFDRGSGLLARRVVRLPTPMGRLPVQIDYADYREVDGLKVPFEVRLTDWETVLTKKFAGVELNAAIDQARFKAPK
jgi:photosynthetic reaction center cytochrome c subunit